jgi:signal transduction histidine kinase
MDQRAPVAFEFHYETTDTWWDNRFYPVPEGLAVFATDVTDRKKAEAEVGRQAARAAALSQRLLEVQEAERRLIARQLHDDIGQELTAVKMNLQALRRTAGQEASAQVDDSIGILEATLERVRSLSQELRPAVLDDLGLAAALRWYVDRQAQRAGFEARVVADLPETRLPAQVETASFRVTQEALTNIVRHARATHVEVQLRRYGDALELLIHDDGVGFDVPAAQAQAVRGSSLGLLGMQERVVLAGGDLKIESAPNQGSRVLARFPLEGGALN